MSERSPLWLSIARNAYNPNSGIPVICQAVTEWTVRVRNPADPTSEPDNAEHYRGSPQDIAGFRDLPVSLVEDIFVFAAHESNYTRWVLPLVCRSWRDLSLSLQQTYARFYVSRHDAWVDQVGFSIEGCKPGYRHTMAHIHLYKPTPVQLYDLVAFVPTVQWESLHIELGSSDIGTEAIQTIFTGMEFPNLTSLYIDERITDMGEGDLLVDPYESLYNAIFLTASKLRSLYVRSDLKGVAPQYGLFGQTIRSLGGSPTFIRNALPPSPEANVYITRIILHTWDLNVVKNLNLPNLRHLKVDHCIHDDNWMLKSADPSIILPSLLEVHLTTHSFSVLPQICAAGLEVLMIDKNEERWDGCAPDIAYYSTMLKALILDVWSTASLDRVVIHMPVGLQYLLTFLHNAKALRDLTLVVPNDEEWHSGFVGAMGARWGRNGHLAHCPGLVLLTLLMDWAYTEGEWINEIRTIFYAREGTEMRSIICRWTRDGRQVQSGPAGDFGVFAEEYRCPAEDPGLGTNIPSEAKQVEKHVDAEEGTEDEAVNSDEYDNCDEEEDDIFGSYEDISFP